MNGFNLINLLGGRKTVWLFAYLGVSVSIVWHAIDHPINNTIDWFGLAQVITAISIGVSALVYGNVKEHQAQIANKPTVANNATVQPTETPAQ